MRVFINNIPYLYDLSPNLNFKRMRRINIGLLLAILAIGCNKKDEIKYVTSENKARFNFQKGSYWIYKDSLTGKEDSFYVHQNTTSIKRTNYEYIEALVRIHNDTTECSYTLHQTFFQYALFKPQTGFSMTTSDLSAHAITLNGKAYDSVHITPVIEGSYYFLRHNIGMVKMVVNKGAFHRVWELLRYNIVK
jgi:hypothetical protein